MENLNFEYIFGLFEQHPVIFSILSLVVSFALFLIASLKKGNKAQIDFIMKSLPTIITGLSFILSKEVKKDENESVENFGEKFKEEN